MLPAAPTERSSPTHRAGAARRGTARAATVLALTVAAALVHVSAGAAPAAWSTTRSASTTVSTASIARSMVLLRGAGTRSGDTYTLGGLVAGQAGYLDLVNDSTAAATLTLSYSLGSLVAGNMVRACSQPWTAAGTCPSPATTTTVAGGGALSSATGSYTTPAPLPPGGRLQLRVDAIGVGTLTTVTATPALARPGRDRTLG